MNDACTFDARDGKCEDKTTISHGQDVFGFSLFIEVYADGFDFAECLQDV